ncbi:prolyl oligopeptidase family serine peptidase [Haliscomenobacter hydrossis]|uniref:Secreted prolyl oligopeptidase family protein n=1 Tax=Haliscomenobacter hydrossis (strain ATCC 27775 / DSM 1100 / LMG 10767 / O) TaxID=760192 RepID=F4L0K0_HALH1|nr:prolyl oligopeptidase family serine peptidase [Haliscomenobacter hydrossis]AEE48512.1 secreted prolyl oligopeptidase family protein [Haliscomenobacter hydrossis DSM 1100]
MKKSLVLLTVLIGTLSCKQKPAEAPPRNVKKYTIEQFYANKGIGGGSFSPDESKLLVHSNETGIFNLYEINLADQSMTAITKSTTESIFAVDYVPGTGEILYAADKGGNEIDHLYLLKADGMVQDLTPAPKEKANFFGWSQDKKALYYISNKRDERFFDLYKMGVGDWKATLLYQNNEGYDIAGLSWDEKSVALNKNITTSENQLFLYDLGSKKMTEISEPGKKGIYGASGFSKDGKAFYYLSNAGKEFQSLEQYSLADGKRKEVFSTTWDVMYAYDSENEKYRVIAINADGKNELKVIDNKSGQEVALPEIPDGDVTAVSISTSENKMRLTVGTSKAPSNIYLYDFKTKELKKLTETLNKELNPDDLVAAEVVRYKSYDGLEIPAIYYKPHPASTQNKVPALIWVHGGPGGQSRVGYTPLVQYLVNHGYAVLAVNNRGSSGYGQKFYQMDDLNHGEKDLKDCIWGKKYLQSLAYIDSSKIGIIGGSYGGYMTMAAMTFAPDEFKVGVDIFGVTNWLRTLKSIPPYWESFRSALYAELGDPFTADSVRLHKISPLFHTEHVKNPIMVLQGANDPRVLQVESDEIVAGVKKNKVPVEYIVFPDEGHGFVKKENEIKGYSAVLKFLDKYLKQEKEMKN